MFPQVFALNYQPEFFSRHPQQGTKIGVNVWISVWEGVYFMIAGRSEFCSVHFPVNIGCAYDHGAALFILPGHFVESLRTSLIGARIF